MAINVNTVYTTVLTILNKEQRGYLTPFEFNKVANQVQLEIFEKFFEDYNQYIRMPKTDVEFASRIDHIREEFQVFEKTGPSITIPADGAQTDNIYNQPSDLHRFGSASWNKGVNSPPIEILSNRDYNQIKLSPLTQPTNNFPVAKYQQDKLTIFPASSPYASNDVTFNYIRKPSEPRWGYQVGALGQLTYDPTVFEPDLLNANSSLVIGLSPNFTTATALPSTAITPGVTTGVTITTANPDATGLVVRVSITNGEIFQLQVKTPGTGYASGDFISFNGANFGQTGTIAKCFFSAPNFNSGSTFGSTDFEISDSMQTEVILEILKYSGIIIRDPQIIQAAQQELVQDEANEKR